MTLTGFRNGRPLFDMGNRAPTAEERRLLEGSRIEGQTLVLRDGRVLRIGDRLL